MGESLNISKENFCRIINKMQKAWDADCKVFDIARETGSDFLGTDLSYLAIDVCELLELITNDINEDVSYFCFCADFGRGWYPGMITDADGNDIDLSSVEKLYDFLVNNKE